MRYLDLSHDIVDTRILDSVIIVLRVISAHGMIAKSLDYLEVHVKGLDQGSHAEGNPS